ncbi:MAG: MarC family protein [Rhodocyclaceae bacterium]|nr:MarC family protein [Rhodocyclaceae bacterium]
MPGEFLAMVLMLLILLDPLGNIPLLLSLLKGVAPVRRGRVILRENGIAALLLLTFVFIGDWLLSALRLSPAALEITSGLILFMIAVRMVFPMPGRDDEEPDRATEPLIVPIAIPMIAGPAALATVLLASRHDPKTSMLVGAILVAIALNTAILLAGERLAQLFGRPGLAAMERLMGLVLTTMAVQMLISGIRRAFFDGT